jgi:hypothetical protein
MDSLHADACLITASSITGDLDRLEMAGISIADLLVGRILFLAAGIAGHAGHTVIGHLFLPKKTDGEGGLLQIGRPQKTWKKHRDSRRRIVFFITRPYYW